MVSRRQFLIGGALFGSACLYSYNRGIRYPRLSLEPPVLSDIYQLPHALLTLKDAIVTGASQLRAIAPEPKITVESQRGIVQFSVSNIAPNAKLSIIGKGIKRLDEEMDGLTRHISLDSAIEQTITLNWQLDVAHGFEFAVMGDTGGGSELAWTLKRAHQLGAQFLIHLGDFNYTEGEYTSAIDLFNSSPMPCYVTIGNHDFHDNGLIYQKFLNEIGPMNHAFELAGTRFINIDTAADFFPAHGGLRGQLLDQLTPTIGEQVVFTHRPLKDPRPHDDHNVGGINEVSWLVQEIERLGSQHFLHGHVHHSAELDFQGIRQICAGEGLGYEDLVHQKQVATIMMAKIEPGIGMTHDWHDLKLPWSAHQNPTHAMKLKRQGRLKELEWYTNLIKNKQA